MRKPWNLKVQVYWTIWALGLYYIRAYDHKIIGLKLFIGPLVFTFWR